MAFMVEQCVICIEIQTEILCYRCSHLCTSMTVRIILKCLQTLLVSDATTVRETAQNC